MLVFRDVLVLKVTGEGEGKSLEGLDGPIWIEVD
jgi:hypothetical protein